MGFGNDLELKLRIRAVAEGLQSIRDTIGELDAAGVSTDEFRKDAAELNEELQRLEQEQNLVQAFRKSKAEIQDRGEKLAKAREEAAKLAGEFK